MSRYNHKFSSAFLTWTIFLQHCFFPRYSHHHQVDQYRLWDLLVFSLTHFKTMRIHLVNEKKSFSLSQESSKLQSYLENEKNEDLRCGQEWPKNVSRWKNGLREPSFSIFFIYEIWIYSVSYLNLRKYTWITNFYLAFQN